MIPLTFAPDANPTAPGVIVDGHGFVPTNRGYRDAPVPVQFDTEEFPGQLIPPWGFMGIRQDGNARLFVADQNSVFERTPAGWVSRFSNPIGTMDWQFAQFGDKTFVGGYSNDMMQSASTTFSVVAGAPRPMSMAVTNNHQLMVVGYTGQDDGWWCSAIGDPEDWTPDLATECANARFLATPGCMTGCIKFGADVLAFKERSIYRMTYVNVPLIWRTEVISDEIGALGVNAIADIGSEVVFVGVDDFYRFAGGVPVPIGGPIRDWFFSRLDWESRSGIRAIFDGRLVWFLYQAQYTNYLGWNEAVVYHPDSGKWGAVRLPPGLAAPMILRTSAITTEVGVDHTKHVLGCMLGQRLCTVTGRTGSAAIRLGWMGDDATASTLTKIRPRFMKRPTTAAATFFFASDPDAPQMDRDADLVEGAFDTQRNALWHSAEMRFGGEFELLGIADPLPRSGGKR